jgi:hypothetical protein
MPNTLNAEPTRMNERTEQLDAIETKFNADIDPPILTKLLVEIADPRWK